MTQDLYGKVRPFGDAADLFRRYLHDPAGYLETESGEMPTLKQINEDLAASGATLGNLQRDSEIDAQPEFVPVKKVRNDKEGALEPINESLESLASRDEYNKNLGEQLNTAVKFGVPRLITSYATTKLQYLLDNYRDPKLNSGVYKIDEPLYPRGGEPGSPQVIQGLGNVEIFQAEIGADIFRVGGKSDVVLAELDKLTHRMYDPASQYLGTGGKGVSDRNASDVSVKADRITVRNCGFYETAMQGIINWAGGEHWLVQGCRGIRLGREFFFTNGGKYNLVIGNIIDHSGDDAIAFAQAADHCSAIGNVITNAGRYNLGGSGIRTNGYGTIIQGNRIYFPTVFGIVVAETSDRASRPDDVELIGNGVYGLLPHGTNTAFVGGIAIQNALRIKMIGGIVNLAGSAQAYPAIRVYGDKATTTINVTDFTARNARELIYLMGAGTGRLIVKDSELFDCVNFLAMQDSGEYLEIKLSGNRDSNRGAGSVLRLNGATAPVIGSIKVKDHESRNPTAGQTAISMANQTATKVTLQGNDWAGSTPVSAINNVADLYTDGDQSGKRTTQGIGTIPAGSTSVTIAHGIKDNQGNDVQPSPYFLEVGQFSAAVPHRVGTPGTAFFTVGISTAQAADVTFRWSIKPRLLHYSNGTIH